MDALYSDPKERLYVYPRFLVRNNTYIQMTSIDYIESSGGDYWKIVFGGYNSTVKPTDSNAFLEAIKAAFSS